MPTPRRWLLGISLAALAVPAGVHATAPATTPEKIHAARTARRIDEPLETLWLARCVLDPEHLPAEVRGEPLWDGTPVLEEVRRRLPRLAAGPVRDEVKRLLAGACGSSSDPLANVTDTVHFHIEWDAPEAPLTFQDYADGFEAAWTTLVDAFGWPAPPVLAANPPPGGRYHVRIADIGGTGGYVSATGVHAGLVGDNPASPWDDVDAEATCIVVNSRLGLAPPSPLDYCKTVTAHEFTHALQWGVGANQNPVPDAVWLESVAEMMGDEVQRPSRGGNHRPWPDFGLCMGEYTLSAYNYWVVMRALTEPLGATVPGGAEQVFQDFYADLSQGRGSGLDAFDRALGGAGTSLAAAYRGAAVALRFSHACGGGWSLPYCVGEGADWLALKGPPPVTATLATVPAMHAGRLADALALAWIDLPTSGSSFDLTLVNDDALAGRLGLDLACDTGSGLEVLSPAPSGPGGSVEVSGYDAGRCQRLCAVVTSLAWSEDDPPDCPGHDYHLELRVPANIRLYAVKDAVRSHAQLHWSGGAPDYRVLAGPAPAQLVEVARVAAPPFTDPDLIGLTPPLKLFEVR